MAHPDGSPASPVPENLPPHLHDVYRNSEETPNGRSFFSSDEQNMRDLAQQVQAAPNHYVVDGHGSPDGMRVGDQPLSARDVADLIRSDPNWNGREVMLVSCETGQGPDSFASRLSRELGVPVIAPDGLAWTDSQGRVFSSSGSYDAGGTHSPTWPPDGAWNAHHPDGAVTSTGEAGFPPGHEPAAPDSGATDRGPGDLQMGDDGRFHREGDAPGSFRDPDGTLHHDGDPAGWHRSEDGKLHHPEDPADSFRDSNQRLRDTSGGFIKDHLTGRDIDYHAQEGQGSPHQLTDDARADLDGLTHDRADLAREAAELRTEMDPHLSEFNISDRHELSQSKLQPKLDELADQVRNDPNLSDEEKAAKLDRLEDLGEIAEVYNENQKLLKRASEQMGMVAAVDYATNGLGGTRLTPTVEDLSAPGKPGTIDVIAFADGSPPRLICVEAKGGGSELGTRIVEDGKKAQQGSPEYLANLLARDPDLKAALGANSEIQAKIEQALADGTLEIEYHRVHASEDGVVTQSEFNLVREAGTAFAVDRISGTTPVDGQQSPASAGARDSAPPPPRPESVAARSAGGDSTTPAGRGEGGATPDGAAPRPPDGTSPGEGATASSSEAPPRTDEQPVRDAGRTPEVVFEGTTAGSRAEGVPEAAAAGSGTAEPAGTGHALSDPGATGETNDPGAVRNEDATDAAERADTDPNDADADGETDVDMDADGEADSEADADGVTDSDVDADGETDVDMDADGVADADADADGETDSDMDADGVTDGDGDVDVDVDADGVADADAGADGGVDADMGADGDSGTDADADGETDSDMDADGVTDGDADADGVTDGDADADGDTDGDADADGDTDGHADADGDTNANADADGGTDADADADPRPGHLDPDGIRRFDTNEDGSDFGDNHLSDAYRNLPPELQASIDEYTRHSWPYNSVLRPPYDINGNLNNWYNSWNPPGRSLFDLNGGRAPALSDIYSAASRTDLTPEQRHVVNDILNSPDPGRRLDGWIAQSGARGMMIRSFGHFPSPDDLVARIREIDQVLNNPLAEGVQVQRGLQEVGFMVDAHGNPLGVAGDPRSLIGTRQVAHGYVSSSLGSTPAEIDGQAPNIVMHLDVPAGARGMWMGKFSLYPDQRELILQRETQFDITDVTMDADGKWHITARVVVPTP